jgi:fused signal recognition particle receptor
MGFFDKFKQGLAKTKALLTTDVRDLFKAGEILGEEQLEQFHARLISTDMGVVAAQAITDELRKEHLGRTVDVDALWLTVKETLKGLLTGEDDVVWDPEDPLSPLNLSPEGTTVILVAGVNGVGKTTTIGKLAHRFAADGKSVLLAAGDTFRAAAIEQLEVWSERTRAPIVKQKPGSDPSAVLFDSLRSARAKKVDVVVVDTAGRLHTKGNLMAELEKMTRVAAREVAGAPHEVLLVIDATTGQNGLIQAREFAKTAALTGIVLTKLDGTARGGVVVAIVRELGIPIRFVGTGEKVDDLVEFSPDEFVDSLFAD